jgi:hypothetical protein
MRYRIVSLLTLGLLAQVARADVELKDEERDHLGIRSEPLQVVEAARRWQAAGTVVDVSTLITSLSDLASAETAAVASRDEADRTEKLYRNDTNVSRKTLDAARLQAITDAGKVAATRGSLLATWGRTIATLSPSARQQLVADLLNGRSSLVRAEQLGPIPAEVDISSAQLTGLNGGSWSATSLGPLPQAAGAASSGALLLKVNSALPAGQFVQIALVEAHASLKGATVPAAAIIRWHGSEWVYEEDAKNHFVRYEIHPGPRVDGRALLGADVPAEHPVVTVGARALLAAELGAADESAGN